MDVLDLYAKISLDKSEYDKVLAELTSAAQDEKQKWLENQRQD